LTTQSYATGEGGCFKRERLLLEVLRDPIRSQRELASSLAVSTSLVNYLLRRYRVDGTLGEVSLYVASDFLGMVESHVVCGDGMRGVRGLVLSLEGESECNYYVVYGESKEDLSIRLRDASVSGKHFFLSYFQDRRPRTPSKFHLRLLKLMAEIGGANYVEVARRLGVSLRSVKRHVDFLKGRGAISFLPHVSLRDGDSRLFTVFTRNPDLVENLTSKFAVGRLTRGTWTAVWGIAWGEEGERTLAKVRRVDRDSLVGEYFDLRLEVREAMRRWVLETP